MSIYLQNFMPIQPRTSLLKFGHYAVNSGKGTVLYLSTKVQVAARDDHYVSAAEGLQLHASLRGAVPDGRLCELRWVNGGHATAFLRLRELFVPACVAAA